MKTPRFLVRYLPTLLLGASLSTLTGCLGPSDAPKVELPVVVDSSNLQPVVNDLGYEVELHSLRVCLDNLFFTVAGEAHSALSPRVWSEILVARAFAHPGHFQGGEITGELLGSFVIDWPQERGRSLGTATLIATQYHAANFSFGRGAEPRLPPGDPLLGHTAILRGRATKDERSINFQVVLDSPIGRQLIGAPFEAKVPPDAHAQSGHQLQLRFHTRDPLQSDTLFDGIDFAALDQDRDGNLLIQSGAPELQSAYNRLRRVFQTHDHYSLALHTPLSSAPAPTHTP